jgi:hypothetical protein
MHFIGQLWMEINGLLQTNGKIWSLDWHKNLDMQKKIIRTSMLGTQLSNLQPTLYPLCNENDLKIN